MVMAAAVDMLTADEVDADRPAGSHVTPRRGAAAAAAAAKTSSSEAGCDEDEDEDARAVAWFVAGREDENGDGDGDASPREMCWSPGVWFCSAATDLRKEEARRARAMMLSAVTY